jgi:hypothetical protein
METRKCKWGCGHTVTGDNKRNVAGQMNLHESRQCELRNEQTRIDDDGDLCSHVWTILNPRVSEAHYNAYQAGCRVICKKCEGVKE